MQAKASGECHISFAFTVTSALARPPEMMLSNLETPRKRQEVTIVGIGTASPAQNRFQSIGAIGSTIGVTTTGLTRILRRIDRASAAP
jgi:hypothetical protein